MKHNLVESKKDKNIFFFRPFFAFKKHRNIFASLS